VIGGVWTTVLEKPEGAFSCTGCTTDAAESNGRGDDDFPVVIEVDGMAVARGHDGLAVAVGT